MLGASVALLLAGCVPAAVTRSPAPTAASPTTSSPTPTADDLVSVVITSSGLELHTDDAVTATWDYDAIDDAAVAGLSAAFGFEPAVATGSTPCEGGTCAVTSWTWEGLELKVLDTATVVGPGFVTVTAPTVGDVPITAADGSAVGDDAEPIIAANGEGLEELDEYGIVWVGRTPVENAEREDAFRAVSVILDAERDRVSQIGAPSANYGM